MTIQSHDDVYEEDNSIEWRLSGGAESGALLFITITEHFEEGLFDAQSASGPEKEIYGRQRLQIRDQRITGVARGARNAYGVTCVNLNHRPRTHRLPQTTRQCAATASSEMR